MIKSIKLNDFQAHKESYLEFTSGVNSIIGKSDNGKSAVLRALNLVINNKPNGDNFIRHGEELCIVEAAIDNHILKRFKGKNKNSYFLDKDEFKAFGQDVPDEIKTTLNFSELNIQYQMDSPFLLSESAGEVGKVLNRVVNLEVIDDAVSKVEKMKREVKAQIKNTDQLLTEIQADIKNYEYLDKAEEQMQTIVELYNSIVDSKDKIDDLYTLVASYQTLITRFRAVFKVVKVANVSMTEIDQLQARYEQIRANGSRLNAIIGNLKIVKQNLKKEVKVDFKPLDSLSEKYTVNKDKITKLKSIIEKSTEFSKIETIKKQIQETTKELTKIMPNVCPVCGRS
jgi:exonuclease SbcC